MRISPHFMFGLIDCNNFFVSCERLFKPWLKNRPVIVTSSNDGCAVAMSNEAKAIGITRGVPIFKIRDIIRQYDVAVLPGQHRFYGDLSARVMNTVESVVGDVEVYSIDEGFFQLPDGDAQRMEAIARETVRRVRRWVGIPTSVGVAPTRTLAKIAAGFAKKYPGYRGVCMIDDEDKRRKALALTPIDKVWGIGRRLSARFSRYGIISALDFADLNHYDVERIANVTAQRTWMELNGEPCIDADPETASKLHICSTRTLVPSVARLEELSEHMARFVEIASRKLRRQNSFAAGICVFIQTNKFRTDLPQYGNSAYRHFEEPANDLMILTREAIEGLKSIYRPGLVYRRAGVIISDIVEANQVQPGLFMSPELREKRKNLMQLLDSINTSPATLDKLRRAAARQSANPSGFRKHRESKPHTPAILFQSGLIL